MIDLEKAQKGSQLILTYCVPFTYILMNNNVLEICTVVPWYCLHLKYTCMLVYHIPKNKK